MGAVLWASETLTPHSLKAFAGSESGAPLRAPEKSAITFSNRLKRREARKYLHLAGLVIWLFVYTIRLSGQQPATVADNEALPNAPEVGLSANAPSQKPASPAAPATIAGTVLDQNGAEIQGAQVVLTSVGGNQKRTTESGGNGEFSFKNLPPGEFKVVVSGSGWGTFNSPEITLHEGDFQFVKNIVLPVATTSAITVTADPDQIAEEQLHIAEQQRVLGVFPNFYSSFDWNAPPMHAPQKYKLALRSLIDPTTFASVAGVAGIEQYKNIFPAYGSGAQGYAKRYGAAYADDVSARMLGRAVFPALFHQDPRYFYKGNGSFRSRALYAVSAAFIARGDNGHWQPNYSDILGSFASGGLSNLYYPAENRGVALAFANGAVDIATDAGANLIKEFVLKRFTSRPNSEVGGQP
jgi:hypothetical protein